LIGVSRNNFLETGASPIADPKVRVRLNGVATTVPDDTVDGYGVRSLNVGAS
jgi:hypothetical protein